jgi:ribosomal RNA-processing protein 7
LPIDATENNLRKLFKEVCGARVERVEFDEEIQGQRRGLVLGREMVVQGTVVCVPVDIGRGKKRKRGVDAEEEVVRRQMEEMALPLTWDRRVLKSGGCGVVVFVDEVTRETALKECGRVKRKGRVVEWPTAEGEELGVQREFKVCWAVQGRKNELLTRYRISNTSYPHISIPLRPPTQHQYISNPFHRFRIRPLQTPK